MISIVTISTIAHIAQLRVINIQRNLGIGRVALLEASTPASCPERDRRRATSEGLFADHVNG
jgi:hypothetical protein